LNSAEEKRKTALKDLIRQLHAGVSPQEVKGRFEEAIEGITPLEISKIEQELIEEGMPREEIQRLCQVHLAAFEEQLGKQSVEAHPGSPLRILVEEHKALLLLLEALNSRTDAVRRAGDADRAIGDIEELSRIVKEIADAERHYLREENVLFPILQKHGIKEPPAIMWIEHNQLREMKGQLIKLIEGYKNYDFLEFKGLLGEAVESLSNALSSHIFKENNILYPAAQNAVTDREWGEARREFDEIGYCSFTPDHLITAPYIEGSVEPKPTMVPSDGGPLQFDTGTLTKGEAEAILNALPIDITFVDKDDAVKYFSKSEGRIFVRTRSIIGTQVQRCHPQKSIHVVNRILDDFKAGKRDAAEFWIRMGGRLIYIRYFPVRDRDRNYLGTLEVTQDITNIKEIEGEKRLLDWNNRP